MFGIDGYNIYNFRSKKNSKKSSMFGTMAKKIFNIRKKIRPISQIEEIKKHDNKTFEIIFNHKNKKKHITYECYTADNCSEILAKLNFLRVMMIFLTILLG